MALNAGPCLVQAGYRQAILVLLQVNRHAELVQDGQGFTVAKLHLEMLFLVAGGQVFVEKGADVLVGRIVKHAIRRIARDNPLADEGGGDAACPEAGSRVAVGVSATQRSSAESRSRLRAKLL